MRTGKEPVGQLQTYQHLNHRGARIEEKEWEIGNLLEKIMKETFPNLVKEIDIQFQEVQSHNQDRLKEDTTKTQHN